MSGLALPTRPDNFRSRNRHLIESDVFDICKRVAEVDPNLYVYALDPAVEFADRVYNWAVCEMCHDGVERLVNRYEHLDARIIEDLQYMLKVPFEQRIAEAEKRAAKWEAEYKENELDRLAETIGLPMQRQLAHDGFIEVGRSSYAKRGVKSK